MKNNKGINFFDKYLTLWVTLCIVIGLFIGDKLPMIPQNLRKMEFFHISLPITLLIWLMIFPMMLKIDFSSLKHHIKQPKGVALTVVINWLIKPFTMYFIAYLFFKIIFQNFIGEELAKEYLAGAILLGAAPCTAMVFVWSHLVKGNSIYTLIQVAINDIIILFAFTPIVALLLGISNIVIPYDTLFLSVLLFVVVPFLMGFIVRHSLIKKRGYEYFENQFMAKFNSVTIIGLLLTLIIIFSYQGHIILNNPFHILLIAIPLVIQTFLIFFLSYAIAKLWRIKHSIAAPAGMIGASNFFELAVAVAISLFGLESGATLATVVGVLVEVPVMLVLVRIANSTKKWFQE